MKTIFLLIVVFLLCILITSKANEVWTGTGPANQVFGFQATYIYHDDDAHIDTPFTRLISGGFDGTGHATVTLVDGPPPSSHHSVISSSGTYTDGSLYYSWSGYGTKTNDGTTWQTVYSSFTVTSSSSVGTVMFRYHYTSVLSSAGDSTIINIGPDSYYLTQVVIPSTDGYLDGPLIPRDLLPSAPYSISVTGTLPLSVSPTSGVMPPIGPDNIVIDINVNGSTPTPTPTPTPSLTPSPTPTSTPTPSATPTPTPTQVPQPTVPPVPTRTPPLPTAPPDTPPTNIVQPNGQVSGDVSVVNTDDFEAPFETVLNNANKTLVGTGEVAYGPATGGAPSSSQATPAFTPADRLNTSTTDMRTQTDNMRTGLSAKMPQPLSLTISSDQSLIYILDLTHALPAPANKTYTIDLNPYADSISAIRMLELTIMTIFYWFLVAKCIRGAWSGQ